MVKFIYDSGKEKEILNRIEKWPKHPLIPYFREWVDTEKPKEVFNLKKLAKKYDNLWKGIESQFLKALAEFLEVESPNLPKLETTAYLARTPRYPYNFEKGNLWFAVPLYDLPDRVMQVTAHELTHFYIFEIFKEDLSKFNKVMVDNIKEVATVIAVCTHFQKFLKLKEGFHGRNREFANFASQRIEDLKKPKFSEILTAAEEFTKRT